MFGGNPVLVVRTLRSIDKVRSSEGGDSTRLPSLRQVAYNTLNRDTVVSSLSGMKVVMFRFSSKMSMLPICSFGTTGNGTTPDFFLLDSRRIGPIFDETGKTEDHFANKKLQFIAHINSVYC